MLTGIHHHHIDKLYLLKNKLGLLYFHLMLQTFAISLISVFVPVYLLTIDFTLSKVFLYLLIEWTVFGLFSPFYGKIIHKLGLKEVIFLRTPILALALWLINSLETSNVIRENFYIIPILIGIAGALYTLSITSLFASILGNAKQSLKTAKMITYPKFISIFSPTLGGIIFMKFGFSTLFFIVITMLFISIIPLIFIKTNLDHPRFDLKIFKTIKIELKEFVFLNSFGLKGPVTFLILPIALYIYNQNVFFLGIIISILSLVSAIFTLYLGKIVDSHGSKKIIQLGAILSTILFICMGFFFDSIVLYILSFVSGFVCILIDLPYETHLYHKSRETKYSPLEFLVFKEFSLFFGRILLLGSLVFVIANINLAFYIGSFASFVFLFFG